MRDTTFGVLLVLFAALLEGFGQVFLKKSVLGPARRWGWVTVGIAVLAAEAVIYTQALTLLNVGVAYAVSSLSLVSIAVLSQWLLAERLTGGRWIGVGLILLGVVLVTARA